MEPAFPKKKQQNGRVSTINERIKYKLLYLTYKALTTAQPTYLQSSAQPDLCSAPRATRSSSVVAGLGLNVPQLLVPSTYTQTTPKWAWPGSRDPISKFWDPLITFERIEPGP